MKDESVAVDAVAQPCWSRTIFEDVTLVAATTAAMDFRAHIQEQCAVLTRAYRVVERLPETWPAGAAIVFMFRGKQGQIAAGAVKKAGPFFIVQRTGKGTLGAMVAENVILLRRKNLPPFFGRFRNLERLG